MEDVHVNIMVHVFQWALPIVDGCRPCRAVGPLYSSPQQCDISTYVMQKVVIKKTVHKHKNLISELMRFSFTKIYISEIRNPQSQIELDSQNLLIQFNISTTASKIIKYFRCCLDDVRINKWSSLCCTLNGIFDSTFPF